MLCLKCEHTYHHVLILKYEGFQYENQDKFNQAEF